MKEQSKPFTRRFWAFLAQLQPVTGMKKLVQLGSNPEAKALPPFLLAPRVNGDNDMLIQQTSHTCYDSVDDPCHCVIDEDQPSANQMFKVLNPEKHQKNGESFCPKQNS